MLNRITYFILVLINLNFAPPQAPNYINGIANARESVSSKANRTSVDGANLEESIFLGNPELIFDFETKIARMLQIDPSNTYANYLMAMLLLRAFQYDPSNFVLLKQSTELAAQTYDLDNESDFALASLANILDASGEIDRGLSLINEAKSRNIVFGWRSHFSFAKLLLSKGLFDDSAVELRKALSFPDASQLIISPTIVSLASERFSGRPLVDDLKKWSKHCKTLTLDLALANAKASVSDFASAESAYLKILESYPDNFEATVSHGILTQRFLHNDAHAIKIFQKAARIAKTPLERQLATTHLAIAAISSDTLSAKSASNAAIEAINTSVDRELTFQAIIAAYSRQRSPSVTVEFLSELETTSPGMHLGYALKGEILNEKLRRPIDALRSFTDAIILEPSRGDYFNGRGLTWMSIGKLDYALKDFKVAIDSNPNDSSAKYNLACAHARLGHFDEAVLSLEEALALDQKLVLHAVRDKDLESLKTHPGFINLLNTSPQKAILAH